MAGYENKSGLVPLGHAVLIKHYQPERKGGLIVIPETVQDRQVLVEQRAEIVAVGPQAWKGEMRAQPGDKVLVAKLSGYMAIGPADGERYVFINDVDIFAKITHDAGHSAPQEGAAR